jgi:hypothetical protein
MDETRKPTLIASVQRALRLMEVVASHPSGAPAKQLAREARLPLATTYHLLRTLAHEGYATRLPDGVWVLGERVEALHGQSRAQQLLARIRPTLMDLRDDLGVAAYFSMHMDDEIRLIDIADGPRTPRVDVWVGFSNGNGDDVIGATLIAPDGTPFQLSTSGASHTLHVSSAQPAVARYEPVSATQGRFVGETEGSTIVTVHLWHGVHPAGHVDAETPALPITVE